MLKDVADEIRVYRPEHVTWCIDQFLLADPDLGAPRPPPRHAHRPCGPAALARPRLARPSSPLSLPRPAGGEETLDKDIFPGVTVIPVSARVDCETNNSGAALTPDAGRVQGPVRVWHKHTNVDGALAPSAVLHAGTLPQPQPPWH